MDAHTHLDSEEVKIPANGDISICLYCGAFAEFSNGSLIPLSNEIIETIQKEDPETWHYLLKVQSMVRHENIQF